MINWMLLKLNTSLRKRKALLRDKKTIYGLGRKYLQAIYPTRDYDKEYVNKS